uniref:Uncharacterized protein n=1 Tax=Tanacetum cinerariifolium TaxID=118510 RepID=A0A6L2L6M7_TANCI|nr:hypothetical protein [Tanacetum cinerariifolium]
MIEEKIKNTRGVRLKGLEKRKERKEHLQEMRNTKAKGRRIRKLRPDEASAAIERYEPLHKGVKIRLGGVEREMSHLELGWRVSLYSESIGDGGFNVGNTKAKSISNPRIKLVHRCITMTIAGRKETTNRVTKIDLFYLYCVFEEGVICNIPYWLAKYLKIVKDKSIIFKGMFVMRIARSFGLLTNEMVSVLIRKPPLHVYRKTSLVKMGVIMELYEGEFVGRLPERLWRKVKVMMKKAMKKGKTKELGAPRTSTAT